MCLGLLLFGYACFEIYVGRASSLCRGSHDDIHRNPISFWVDVMAHAILGLLIAFKRENSGPNDDA